MTDLPFFFNKKDADARRTPKLPPIEAERVVAEYIDEHNDPAIIHASGVDQMLRKLKALNPSLSENDLDRALKAYGYVVNDISSEVGDYKRTRT
jgi:hypothetical protein